MKRIFLNIIVLAFLLVGCTLPQSADKPTAEPAQSLIKTVVAATLQALTPQSSPQIATVTSAATETPAAPPSPATVNVSGKVCYQNKGMLKLTLYFQPDASDKVLTQTISRPTETYSIELPHGKYKIYGWPPDYTIGVLVKDRPTLDVTGTQPVTHLDFCDYSKGPFAVPYPPGVSPSNAAGSIAGTISGYAGDGSLTVVATNQGSGYW